MKNNPIKKIICVLCAALALLIPACGGQNEYKLNEKNFFLVMTNMWYYPAQYVGCDIECDVFTYRITDLNGKEYLCGVRKCSAGYGCTCGADTVIGFILSYDGEIPEPRNQSEDTGDKSWIHIKGKLKSDRFTDIEINSYDASGNVVDGVTETVKMLEFEVEELTEITDWSGLNYYVTK